MKKYAFGIDLGGTTVKLGLFTTEGLLVDKWEIKTIADNSGEKILPDIAEALNRKIAERNININDLEGIGIGVPGAVLNDEYVIRCVNLNGWGDFNVAEKLTSLCGLPVKVTNDANAAALGEMWQGSAKGHQNIVFVTLGTGVGGGIVINGKILSGAHGSGGEIGHIKVKTDEKASCGCGKRGCLEQYASATGIVRSAMQLLENSDIPSKLRELGTVTAKNIFDLAKENDALAVKLIENMSDDLGRVLAAISCVCDPEAIVIGGGVSKAGKILIEHVQKAFVKYAFPASETTEFSLASLGNDAGIYGCVKLILK